MVKDSLIGGDPAAVQNYLIRFAALNRTESKSNVNSSKFSAQMFLAKWLLLTGSVPR